MAIPTKRSRSDARRYTRTEAPTCSLVYVLFVQLCSGSKHMHMAAGKERSCMHGCRVRTKCTSLPYLLYCLYNREIIGNVLLATILSVCY